MTGNFTGTADVPTVFRYVSANLGIDPTVLFIFGFIFTAIPLMLLKAPKTAYPLFFLMYSFFGLFFGLVPIWVSMIGIVSTLLFAFGEASKIFRGDFPDFSDVKYTKTYVFTPSPPEPEPEKVTINCKNCGGPNVERVTCEYCGQVLD